MHSVCVSCGKHTHATLCEINRTSAAFCTGMRHLCASHMQDARKHILGRARHEHMVICFPPLDVQRAARQVHPAHTPSAMVSVAHTYSTMPA